PVAPAGDKGDFAAEIFGHPLLHDQSRRSSFAGFCRRRQGRRAAPAATGFIGAGVEDRISRLAVVWAGGMKPRGKI
ncbi:MAG: hypothetical protein ACREE4_15790, partial [Stellaceae bacterium]